MELICPKCLGLLATADGKSARCTTHGDEFQILFSHFKPPPPARPPPIPDSAPQLIEFLPTRDARCVRHAELPATHICGNCGTSFCETCAFDGSRCCSNPDIKRANKAEPALTMSAEPPPVIANGCARHPTERALFICRGCGTHMCNACAFKDTDGSRYCPDCITRRATTSFAPVETPPAATARCVQHPNVRATRYCKLCGGCMCATCDFVLPEGYHICPACAAAPQNSLNRTRKKLLIASYVLGIWCTILFGAMVSGFFAQYAREDASTLGLFLLGFLLLPSIAGFNLALSAKNRRLPNSPFVWVSLVWNGMICGGFLLMLFIGLMKH